MIKKFIHSFKYGLAVVLAVILILALSIATFGLKPFVVKEYVTDKAVLLTEAERSRLSQLLAEYAKQTGNQILVVTIPTLEGEPLEDFTLRLAELNKPGQKGKDNGLILLVAEKERQVRIEVGYGLEGAVPDGKAGTIIRQRIVPYFKAGDYNLGITSGIYALISAITPDYPLAINHLPERPRQTDRSVFSGIIFIIILVIIISIFRNRNNRRYQRGYSESWFWGGGSGGGFLSGGFGGGSSGGSFGGGGGSFGGGGASGKW